VIAIISVLIAILLPALSAARVQSKRLYCQNNLRQIATAWESYLNSNQECFLQGINADITFGGRQGKGGIEYGSDPNQPVRRVLNPHLGLPEVVYEGAEVFQCPADTGSKTVRPTLFEQYGNSYGTNFMLIGQAQFTYPPFVTCAELFAEVNERMRKLKRDRIGGESRLILVGDFGWRTTWRSWDTDPTRRIEWHRVPRSHNLAFLDGHASFVRVRKGLHVTPEYTIIPFESLWPMAEQCQEELP
jgi:prepilin-type processing-associated H-X9-DG protein